METQNRELKAQVTQTKRILTRLEEQQVKAHETQLNQMFQMQQNNEEMQSAMQGLQEENGILREYLTDLEQESEQIKSDNTP